MRFQIIVFALVRIVFNTMHRMVYPFLSTFAAGLGVGLPAISLALTVRALSGFAGPLVAPIADTRGRKIGLLFGLGLYTIGVGLMVVWPVFPVFVLTLILTNIGNLTFIPSMQAYLGDRVPYSQRGLAMAVTEMGWSLSFIITVPLAGLLIARSGWQAPFPILAIMGCLSFLLLLWMLPKDPSHPDGRPSFFQNLHAVLTSTLALTGLSLGLLFSSANETINLVFGVWLENSFGLEIAILGAVSLVIGVAELGGESLVALFTDRLGKPRAIAFGLAGNCLALVILMLLGHWIAGAVLSLFLFFLSFEFTIVSALPLMSELMPARRATLMSTNMAFISLGRALGAALATPLYVSLGIWANAALAIFFNVLGLVVLAKLTRGMGKRA